MQPSVLVVSCTSARFLAEEHLLCSSCSRQSQRSRAFSCCRQGPVGSVSSISPKKPHLALPHTLCPLAEEAYFSLAQHTCFLCGLGHESACPCSWAWLYFLDGAGMCVVGSWSPALPPGWTWGPQHSLVSSPVSGHCFLIMPDTVDEPCSKPPDLLAQLVPCGMVPHQWEAGLLWGHHGFWLGLCHDVALITMAAPVLYG